MTREQRGENTGKETRLLSLFVGAQHPLQFEFDSDRFHAPFIWMDPGVTLVCLAMQRTFA